MSRDTSSGTLFAAADVLRPNARTRCAFDATVLGRFVAAGPNAWDPFRFAPDTPVPIRVFPGIAVQLEQRGSVIRMRARGAVIRVAWAPAPEVAGGTEAGLRERFVDRCLVPFAHARGIGATAVIARELQR